MQQFRVGDAVVPSRRRKFLALRDLRIGISFEEIENALSREAKIDAGIAIGWFHGIDELEHIPMR